MLQLSGFAFSIAVAISFFFILDVGLWCTRVATMFFCLAYIIPVVGNPVQSFYKVNIVVGNPVQSFYKVNIDKRFSKKLAQQVQ